MPGEGRPFLPSPLVGLRVYRVTVAHYLDPLGTPEVSRWQIVAPNRRALLDQWRGTLEAVTVGKATITEARQLPHKVYPMTPPIVRVYQRSKDDRRSYYMDPAVKSAIRRAAMLARWTPERQRRAVIEQRRAWCRRRILKARAKLVDFSPVTERDIREEYERSYGESYPARIEP